MAFAQAWRSLARRPGFFLSTVLTLAFGTGLTTAVFSLVDTVLLKPLPYPEADRLVAVYEASPVAREKTSLIAPGRLEDWHRRNHTFISLSGSYAENVTDTSGAEPERLEGRRVAPRFFAVYGTPPVVGRVFVDDEEQANGPGAVVISERFWVRRFQRDPAAIGRSLTIGGRPFQIVGVMPATFTSATTDVWLPAQFNAYLLGVREARFLTGIGRLKPGVTAEAGIADLAAVQEALGREFPKSDAGWSVDVRPLKEWRIGDARRGLVMLFGAVASLWIIAIANIAGLMLVQVHRRARELAVRAALGASRARVIGVVIREGLIIACIGGTLGALLARWLVAIMPTLLTSTPRINELAVDWRSLLLIGLTSLIAVCAIGVLPAISATGLRTSANVNALIAGGNRTVHAGAAAGHHGLQRALVVGQVAVSVLLVATATLLLGSYYRLTHADVGFDSANVITFHVGARWDEDRVRVGRMQEQLIAALAQLPHVQAAGLTNFLPATGASLRYQVRVDGLTGPNPDSSMTVGSRTISVGYLRALRVPLVAGSWCPALAMDFKAPRTVLVNQRFVEMYGSNQNLIGRGMSFTQDSRPPLTIRGVIGNVAEDGQAHATSPAPYVYACDSAGSWPDPEYVARTLDPRAFTTDLHRIVAQLDPTRAVFGLRPVQEVTSAALEQPRLDTALLLLFAAAALMLAAIGLYSLFMLLVAERTREIAVRLALGAEPRQMVRMVMTSAGRLLAIGLLLGLALTVIADRLLRSTLFGVNPVDPRALTAAAIILALVSAAAVAAPALRAARIAPVDVLRGD